MFHPLRHFRQLLLKFIGKKKKKSLENTFQLLIDFFNFKNWKKNLKFWKINQTYNKSR